MNEITAEKIVKIIKSSKFARDCVYECWCFDLVVEGIKLEIMPRLVSYYDNGGIARAKGWKESEYIYFEIA